MSASDLDTFCEWVYANRIICNDKNVTVDILLYNALSSILTKMSVEIVCEEERDEISCLQ